MEPFTKSKRKNTSKCEIRGVSSVLRCLRRILIGPVQEGINPYDISYLRERVFTAMSVLLRYPIGLAMIYGAILFFQEGRWDLAFLELGVYLVFLVAFAVKPIRDRLGKQIIVYMMYAFGILLLLYTGNQGAGLLTILLTAIVSSALLDHKENNRMLVLNAVLFLLLSLLLGLGWLDDFGIASYGTTWYINAITTYLAVLGQHFLWNIIYDGLSTQNERYDLVIQGSNDGLWDWDIETDNFYISDRYKEQLGYGPKDLVDSYETSKSLIHPDDRAQAVRILEDYLNGKTDRYVQVFRMQHRDGTFRIIEARGKAIRGQDGKAIRIAGSHADITERIEKEDKIRYLSEYDLLTGLMNINALRKKMEEPSPADWSSILFVDIDNFRLINDTQGTEFGDQMIKELSQKIQDAVDGDGLTYRYEGDEFVVVLKTTVPGEVQTVAQRILSAMYRPVRSDNRIFNLTASIGAAIQEPDETMEQCLRRADSALYMAKKNKNTILFFESSMKQSRSREKILEEDMASAIESGQFLLHYQPVHHIREGRIRHAEALLRWDHPTLGMVSPGEFIPLAERNRFIIPLTEWILQEVCRQLSAWKDTPLKSLTIAMNLSFLSLEHKGEDFIRSVSDALETYAIDPERLNFEITETTVMGNTSEIIETLNQLKSLGIKLSLDDFGTGYSTFGYLKALPIDVVKLDRSLILNIETDEQEQLIATSLCSVIHGLGLEVVAEGVETEGQFQHLRKAGSDSIQGYLFSKPLDPASLERYCVDMEELGLIPQYARTQSLPDAVSLTWNDDWESGDPLIDEQHRKILESGVRIINDSVKENPSISIDDEIDLLLEEIESHFRDEEERLHEIGYPRLSQHRKEHTRLLNQAANLKERYLKGEIRGAAFFGFILEDVLLHHIRTEDILFFPYVGKESDEDLKDPNHLIFSHRILGKDLPQMLLEAISLQELLAQISTLFISIGEDFEDKVKAAMKICANYVQADRVYIFRYDFDAGLTDNIYEWCREGIEPQIADLQRVPLENIADWVDAHVNGDTICIPDVARLPEDSNLRMILEPQGILSLMTFPMMQEETCFGFIGFDSVRTRHEYTEYEQKVLRELACIFLVALERKEVEHTLNVERKLFSTTLHSVDEAIVALDAFGRVTLMNEPAETYSGWTQEEAIGLDLDAIFRFKDAVTGEPLRHLQQKVMEEGIPLPLPHGTRLLCGKDGDFLVSGSISPMSQTIAGEKGVVLAFRDVTKEAVLEQESKAFLEVNLDLLCVANTAGQFLKVNRRFETVLGYNSAELVGQSFLDLIHPEDLEATKEALKELQGSKIIEGFTNRYRAKDGSYRFLEWHAQSMGDGHVYASARDITTKKAHEEEIEYISYHDDLTGLYNRRYVEAKVSQMDLDRRILPISVIVGDINGLKKMNDEHGHAAGDDLIRVIAETIRSNCRPDDIIGRWGGDEFMVLLEKTNPREAKRIIQRIHERCETLSIAGEPVEIALGSDVKLSMEQRLSDVMQQADKVMYEAKAISKLSRK